MFKYVMEENDFAYYSSIIIMPYTYKQNNSEC